jgi:succinyl-CoA synthetase beta subunit
MKSHICAAIAVVAVTSFNRQWDCHLIQRTIGMLLTEHAGKHMLAEAGVSVPVGHLINDLDQLNGLSYPLAVKAQVASGGRGRSGGVARAENVNEARAAVSRILNTRFNGDLPLTILVEPWLVVEREIYLSLAVDDRAGGYVILYGPDGGMDIESASPPLRFDIGHPNNFRAHRLREVLASVERDAHVRERVINIAQRLVRIADANDCTTIEINPLVKIAGQPDLIAVDAKIVLDESAAFRSAATRRALDELRAREPEAVREALANNLMLVWIGGEVGIISGGAGMTMTVMDMVVEKGGKPACFLDCSNNPTLNGYEIAFKLLDEEPCVKAILVSIFGGLTEMDEVAIVMSHILNGRRAKKPIIFRLNGTKVDKATEIFAEAGIYNHPTLESAVEAACKAASGEL